jgi:hypothetical protein
MILLIYIPVILYKLQVCKIEIQTRFCHIAPHSHTDTGNQQIIIDLVSLTMVRLRT